jgi:hypothetical protein
MDLPIRGRADCCLRDTKYKYNRLLQLLTDYNIYNLRDIAGLDIVIAGLYQPGYSHTATVVTQMSTTFLNLIFSTLVGIEGGVHVKPNDGMVRLGDIIVSKPAGEYSRKSQLTLLQARDDWTGDCLPGLLVHPE